MDALINEYSEAFESQNLLMCYWISINNALQQKDEFFIKYWNKFNDILSEEPKETIHSIFKKLIKRTKNPFTINFSQLKLIYSRFIGQDFKFPKDPNYEQKFHIIVYCFVVNVYLYDYTDNIHYLLH